ncbi:MAG TPA: hypothetical protein VGM90_38565 [Kofleriaceae bacterium]|jgi:hypothetical protein
MKSLRAHGWLFAALAAVSATACLQVPDAPKHECDSTADCDGAHGEVCESGTCWGNPPTEQFEYVVSPPAEHAELVPMELGSLEIGDDGRLQLIQLEQPVSLSGQLAVNCVPPMPCSVSRLQATVTVSRDSLFEGGPGFKAVADTTMTNDGAAFSVKVPPFSAGTGFTITIVPQPRTENDETSLAQVVPPLHQMVSSIADAQKAVTLGAIDLEHMEGTLLASSGSGLAGYRVVAMGHWAESTSPVEVSTVAFTGSDGAFRLFLSPDVTRPVIGSPSATVGVVTEIVAAPTDPMSVAPTLHLAIAPAATAIAGQTTLSQPANLGSAQPRTIHITGRDSGGNEKDIIGARVRVSATVATPEGGTAVFVSEANTDDSGMAMLSLLDGAIAQHYMLDVAPPASATVGAIYAQPYALDGDSKVQLPARVRLRGHAVDSSGEKLSGVAVTARPSYRFAWNLDPDAQTFLSNVPVSTAVTNDAGEYVVWVDPVIADVTGTYDLAFDPAQSSGVRVRAASYVQTDVAIGLSTANDSITVDDATFPSAAFVHGEVVDPVGNQVEGAEIKVFQLRTDLAAICSSSQHAPSPCPVQGRQVGRGVANSNGTVELTLPRQ